MPENEDSLVASLPDDVEQRLLGVVEAYLHDLESGRRPDADRLIAEHPDLAEPLQECLGGIEFLQEATASMSRKEPDVASTSRRLGDFEILGELGRGGMGVVYEARQISLDRRVALKVLPFSAVLDQKQVARFENEARAAAHLHHPNIVPVFSVGCERGVHYYSMQYIEGLPLNRAIDEIGRPHAATTGQTTRTEAAVNLEAVPASETQRSRLTIGSPRGSRFFRTVAGLGIQAAEALHHAHECGVVHRDVKPSNLLLDRQGNLWVADFGLARCGTNPSLTSTGGLLGTVRYMSPEQASGKAALVDHRTDVYSLGITLYEMCTLREAFPGKDRNLVLRRIVQEDPPPPRKIAPAIPLDLETVILKATAKSRDQRYGTAGELAEDLGRFVRGEPIRARRATIADRVRKWVARHKTLVRSSLVLAVLAVTILAAANVRTRRALIESEQQRQNAETWCARTRQVLDRFAKRHVQQLRDYPEMEALRQELLKDTIRYYKDFIHGVGDESTLRRDLALSWFRLGKLLEEVPSVQDAEEAYQAAHDLLEQLAEEHPDNQGILADLALCCNNLGCVKSQLGEPGKAESAFEAAIEIQQRLAENSPQTERFQLELALTLGNLGGLQRGAREYGLAEQSYRAALETVNGLAARRPGESKYLHHLAMANNDLGIALSRFAPHEAERYYREALATLQTLGTAHPEDREHHADLALCYSNLGTLKKSLGLYSEAEQLYCESASTYRQIVQSASAPKRYRSELATTYSNLGAVYMKTEQFDRARRTFGQAREHLESLVEQVPECLQYRSLLGGVLNNQATALARLGQVQEAEQAYRQGIEYQRFAAEHAPRAPGFCRLLAQQQSIFERFQETAALHGR